MDSPDIEIDSDWADQKTLAAQTMSLVCPACKNLLSNHPHDFGCGHSVCRSCLTRQIKTKNPILEISTLTCSEHQVFSCHKCKSIKLSAMECLICRKKAINSHDIYPTPTIRQAVEKLDITCPCGAFNHKPVAEYLREHYKKCPDVMIVCVECPDGPLFARKDLLQHQLICPNRKLECALCHQIVKISDHGAICPCYPIVCQDGCGEQFQRQDTVLHKRYQCCKNMVTCPNCSKAIGIGVLAAHMLGLDPLNRCVVHTSFCDKCCRILPRDTILTHYCVAYSDRPLPIERKESAKWTRKQVLEKVQSDLEENKEDDVDVASQLLEGLTVASDRSTIRAVRTLQTRLQFPQQTESSKAQTTSKSSTIKYVPFKLSTTGRSTQRMNMDAIILNPLTKQWMPGRIIEASTNACRVEYVSNVDTSIPRSPWIDDRLSKDKKKIEWISCESKRVCVPEKTLEATHRSFRGHEF